MELDKHTGQTTIEPEGFRVFKAGSDEILATFETKELAEAYAAGFDDGYAQACSEA